MMSAAEQSWSMTQGRVVVVSFDKGDDLLDGIVAVCRDQGVRHGMVATGVGTLDRCRLRVVTSAAATYPSDEEVIEWVDKPFEITGVSGLIVDGAPHVHVTLAHRGAAFGGHLESGSRVFNLAEIAIVELAGSTMSRRPDERGVTRLLPSAVR
jgi:predicted DNA-binding protein with PD1-like motif